MKDNWPKPISNNGFLLYCGIVLLAAGALGYADILGPTMQKSMLHELWWFDNRENISHITLGVFALTASSLVTKQVIKRWLVLILGTLAAIVSVYNMQQTTILHAQLQSPLDTLFHTLIAVWAYVSAFHPQNNRSHHTSA